MPKIDVTAEQWAGIRDVLQRTMDRFGQEFKLAFKETWLQMEKQTHAKEEKKRLGRAHVNKYYMNRGEHPVLKFLYTQRTYWLRFPLQRLPFVSTTMLCLMKMLIPSSCT